MIEIDNTLKCTTVGVAKSIRERIVSGDWKEGEVVPTIRTLAQEFGTSNQTVQNAMHIIEAEGYIKRRSRRPAIVSTRGNVRVNHSSRMQISVKQIGLLELPNDKSDRLDGLAVNDLDNWTLRIFTALREELFAQGYEVVHMPLAWKDKDDLDALVDRGLAGYVFMGRSRLKQLHHSLGNAGIPWVCFCGVGYDDEHNVVHARNMSGGRSVGNIFVRLGYKKVLLIGGNLQTSVTCTQKIAGVFHEYIGSALGVDGLTVVPCRGLDQLAGYEAAKKYIQQFGAPDAIFATGDFLAQGACDALAEAGLAVGEDVGVIGATGLDGAEYFRPPLTVLRQPMEQMGRGAADMLVEMIKNKHVIAPSRGFESRLIVRDSLKIPDKIKADIEKNVLE